jgi:hypothetical protein
VTTAVNNAIPHSIVHIVVEHIAVIIVFHYPIIVLMKHLGKKVLRDREMMINQNGRIPLYP